MLLIKYWSHQYTMTRSYRVSTWSQKKYWQRQIFIFDGNFIKYPPFK